MTITVLANGGSITPGVNTASISINLGTGSNRVLVAWVGCANTTGPTLSSASLGGGGISAGSLMQFNSNTRPCYPIMVSTSLTGTQTLQVNWSASGNMFIVYTVLKGDGTMSFGTPVASANTWTTNPMSIDITDSATGDLIVSLYQENTGGALTPGSGESLLGTFTGGTNTFRGGMTSPGASGTVNVSGSFAGTPNIMGMAVNVHEDAAAPTLTSGVGTATSSTTATAGATTDVGSGTMYAVVTTSATQPSAAQIKAGDDHTGADAVYAASQSITTTGAKTFSAVGLTVNTTYYAHVIQESSGGDSNIISSSAFVTPATLSAASVTLTGATAGNASVTTNVGSGTLYRLVSSNATEIAGTIKGGTTSSPSASGAQGPFSVTVTPGTSYVHFVQTVGSTDSNVVSVAALDTVSPTLSGAVSATPSATSAALSYPAATDVVGVTGYEYRLNGTGSYTSVGNTTSPNITGLLSSTPYTVEVRAFDAAGNRSGVISGSFTTSAGTAAPSITLQPSNQTVTAPASATFTVAASGSPSPTYQWSVNTGSGWSAISGATSASYTTAPTTTAANGYQYRCVASNANGTATSNAATLTVNAASGFSLSFGPLYNDVNLPASKGVTVAYSLIPSKTLADIGALGANTPIEGTVTMDSATGIGTIVGLATSGSYLVIARDGTTGYFIGTGTAA